MERGKEDVTVPVQIPEAQRRVHIATEALALLVIAPFSFWIATRKELPPLARVTAGAIGVGTLLIDGALLLEWHRDDQELIPPP